MFAAVMSESRQTLETFFEQLSGHSSTFIYHEVLSLHREMVEL